MSSFRGRSASRLVAIALSVYATMLAVAPVAHADLADHVKATFFRGTSLRPVPPGPSKHEDVRYVDIHEGDQLGEAQWETWLKQAAALPGWVPGRPS